MRAMYLFMFEALESCDQTTYVRDLISRLKKESELPGDYGPVHEEAHKFIDGFPECKHFMIAIFRGLSVIEDLRFDASISAMHENALLLNRVLDKGLREVHDVTEKARRAKRATRVLPSSSIKNPKLNSWGCKPHSGIFRLV